MLMVKNGLGEGGRQLRLVCVCHKNDNHSHFQHSIQTLLWPEKNDRGHFPLVRLFL